MQKRILIVSQEVSPYTTNGLLSESVLELAKKVKKNKDTEVRLFMPKYGCVNERRHQLHEVIRLSGVNIVVNDIDQPLIVKVASIPQARLQVYFIDNEEYFRRKVTLFDSSEKLVSDNDERIIFFCRGVLETLQMLGWSPDIIHCHGWFTSLLPMYLKSIYKQNTVFEHTKIISSIYNSGFNGTLDKMIFDKIKFDGIEENLITNLKKPNFESLNMQAVKFSDGVIFEDESPKSKISEFVSENGIASISPEFDTDYYNFYQNFFSEALV